MSTENPTYLDRAVEQLAALLYEDKRTYSQPRWDAPDPLVGRPYLTGQRRQKWRDLAARYVAASEAAIREDERRKVEAQRDDEWFRALTHDEVCLEVDSLTGRFGSHTRNALRVGAETTQRVIAEGHFRAALNASPETQEGDSGQGETITFEPATPESIADVLAEQANALALEDDLAPGGEDR